MEERLRFVARRLEGESMTALRREFGISRKTGHKLLARWTPRSARGVTHVIGTNRHLCDRAGRPG